MQSRTTDRHGTRHQIFSAYNSNRPLPFSDHDVPASPERPASNSRSAKVLLANQNLLWMVHL